MGIECIYYIIFSNLYNHIRSSFVVAEIKFGINTLLPIKSLKTSFETALEKAGIKKRVRLYDMRHMYGTSMAMNKTEIFAIQILMGHSDLDNNLPGPLFLVMKKNEKNIYEKHTK